MIETHETQTVVPPSLLLLLLLFEKIMSKTNLNQLNHNAAQLSCEANLAEEERAV